MRSHIIEHHHLNDISIFRCISISWFQAVSESMIAIFRISSDTIDTSDTSDTNDTSGTSDTSDTSGTSDTSDTSERGNHFPADKIGFCGHFLH